MRRVAILAVLSVLICAPRAYAQQAYVQTTVSVNSATVPVAVVPSKTGMTTFLVRPRQSAAVPLLCFLYTGSLPVSAPANCSSPGSGVGCMEVSPAAPFYDASNYISTVNGGFQTAFNQGVACVLESGVTAVTTDGIYR